LLLFGIFRFFYNITQNKNNSIFTILNIAVLIKILNRHLAEKLKTNRKLCLFFLLPLLFYNSILFAQTTIINPTGDGGFETGTTFAANGWTATTGSATRNQWVCNTGATPGFSGTRCAYISNNTAGTPPPYNYTINNARVSHIYKDVTVPAGQSNINLSFSWIGYGEGSFDYLKVWAIPTTTTPVYGTALTTTGAAPTGRVQIGGNLNLQSTWSNITLSLPSAYAGNSFRLVFEWTNDASGGTQPPAAVDNISLVASPPPSNNQCANATTLPCATTNLAGTTIGALSYTNGTGCSMADYGVWYKFTGDGNQTTISVTTTAFDVEMSVASGSCGSLTSITCQDSALSNGTETYTFTTTVGVNYYVYVAYWLGGGTNTGTFTISRTCTTPFNPCASIPTIASCGTATSATITSGIGAYGTSACGFSAPGNEQIYTFTPTVTGNYAIQQASSFASIDYQFKPVSSGCNATGWTCISALTGTSLSTFSRLLQALHIT